MGTSSDALDGIAVRSCLAVAGDAASSSAQHQAGRELLTVGEVRRHAHGGLLRRLEEVEVVGAVVLLEVRGADVELVRGVGDAPLPSFLDELPLHGLALLAGDSGRVRALSAQSCLFHHLHLHHATGRLAEVEALVDHGGLRREPRVGGVAAEKLACHVGGHRVGLHGVHEAADRLVA